MSGSRNRFKDGRFDLDLTYITPRCIAMGLPAEGLESLARNRADEVAAFLHKYHGKGNTLVVNLSEREYDYSLFENNVLEAGFPDHHAPPLYTVWHAVRSMARWLAADPKHIVAVHCKAGKGRTGLVVACFLIFSGAVYDAKTPPQELADTALRLFLETRGQGVKYPSQTRVVRYFATIVATWLRRHRVVLKGNPGAASPSASPDSDAAAGSSGSVVSISGGGGSAHDSSSIGAAAGIVVDSSDDDDYVLPHEHDRPVAPMAASVTLAAEGEGGPRNSQQLALLQAALRDVVEVPLPPARRVVIKSILFSGVPIVLDGGCSPHVTLTATPSQVDPRPEVMYNSAHAEPTPRRYTPDEGIVLFQPRDCVVSGDVTLQCHDRLSRKLLFWVSFHTSFITQSELDGGVFRLPLSELDMESRDSAIKQFPAEFFVDIIFVEAKRSREAGSSGGAGGPSTSWQHVSVSEDGKAEVDREVLVSSDVLATGSGGPGGGGAGGPSRSDRLGSVGASPRAAAAPPSSADTDARIESASTRQGYLFKISGVLAVWKRRYCVLRKGLLSYYKDDMAAKPKGVIDLSRCTGVQVADGDRPFCFVVSTLDRVSCFQANSKEDQEAWVAAIALAYAARQVSRSRKLTRNHSDPHVIPRPSPDVTAAATLQSREAATPGGSIGDAPSRPGASDRRPANRANRARSSSMVSLSSSTDSGVRPSGDPRRDRGVGHDTGSTASLSVYDDEVRARLLAFYQVHKPEKATDEHVTAVLRHYALLGPDRLFADLNAKYSAGPGPES